jgi:hypothetical protein
MMMMIETTPMSKKEKGSDFVRLSLAKAFPE